jgi:hypothetical protein
MTDYYPLIARAIAGLDPGAPGESRRALYERARAAQIAQLRGVLPPLSESEITRERLSLEEAVKKVEAEAAQRARDASRFGPRAIVSDPVGELARLIGKTNPFSTLRTSEKSQEDTDLVETANRLEAVLRRPTAVKVAPKPADIPDPPSAFLPPITVIPEQNEKKAITFRPSRRGPLDLVADPPKDALDPEQSQLYSRIRLQLTKLTEDIPSQERTQIDDVLNDFLDQPATWHEVEYKKVLWLCGNALRNTLAQHDAVKGNLDPHYSKLPPSVAEALRRPVEAWNVFALGDPDLVELDAKRLGPQEQKAAVDNINAARPILETAALDRLITTEQAGKVLTASLKAAAVPVDNINTKQAQDLAEGTSRNLVIQIIRRAYLFCQDLVDPKTDEARALVVEYKKGVARAAGVTTVGAIAATVSYSAPYAASFFEFVVLHAVEIKGYIAVAFQNAQLSQVIDVIEYTRNTLSEQPATNKP